VLLDKVIAMKMGWFFGPLSVLLWKSSWQFSNDTKTGDLEKSMLVCWL